MKKLFFCFTIIILFVMFIAPVNAQDKPVKFGIRLGPQITLINVDMAPLDPQLRLTLAMGGVVEYSVSPNFSLQVNALYNPKGAKYKEEVSALGYTASVELTWQFDYLSFPVLAKFAFGETTKFYLFVGPELAFLLSANAVLKSESNVPGYTNTEDEADIKEYMNSTEIAINSGMGIEIPMQNMTVFIESRGSFSLSDTMKDHAALGVEEGTAMNIILGIYAGVLF